MVPFREALDTLPLLGVGASLSFGADPDPVELARLPHGPSFIEYAGAVQPSWMKPHLDALAADGIPVLYHPSCLNLCGPWPNPPAWSRAVGDHVRAVRSAWLAQDVAVCFVGDPGYSNELGYFLPPILTRASLDQAVDRVNEVTAQLDAPMLLEPAPVTVQIGDMSALAWLGELAERTDCGVLLDAGHVVSHQLAAGRDLLDGLDELDLARVIEIHVAGGEIHERDGRQIYVDAHDLPILPETWRVFNALVQGTPELRAVCVECEGMPAHTVLSMIEATRRRVHRGAANPELVARAGAELSL